MTRNVQNALTKTGATTYSYDCAVRNGEDQVSGLGAWHILNVYAFWGTIGKLLALTA